MSQDRTLFISGRPNIIHIFRSTIGFVVVSSRCVCFSVAPEIRSFEFDGPLNAGDSAVLTCYVIKGDRPLKIKWYHNGKHITHHTMGISTSSFGSQASILNINSVEPNHRGEYTCIATNAAGKSKNTAILEVNGT